MRRPAGAVSGGTGADTMVRAVIAQHSKSFALAAKLLPSHTRQDARVLYAWCRRADDAVDQVPPTLQPARLRTLRDELEAIYAGAPLSDPLLAAFRRTVQRRGIPRIYPDALLKGLEMDVRGTSYANVNQLLCYCYRVAGTVGLMMCHVMGVRGPEALTHAAHLGIAMQLTNIARDVREDWARGRLYLPDDLLACQAAAGDLRCALGSAFPDGRRRAVGRAIAAVLAYADRYYASGDAGVCHLSLRCALAVRTARLVYRDIARVLRKRSYDPLSGRAVVSRGRKLWLMARACLATLAAAPTMLGRPPPVAPSHKITDPRSLWTLPELRS